MLKLKLLKEKVNKIRNGEKRNAYFN